MFKVEDFEGLKINRCMIFRFNNKSLEILKLVIRNVF